MASAGTVPSSPTLGGGPTSVARGAEELPAKLAREQAKAFSKLNPARPHNPLKLFTKGSVASEEAAVGMSIPWTEVGGVQLQPASVI